MLVFAGVSLVMALVTGCSHEAGRDIDDGSSEGHVVLRPSIGLNLADVASFAVVNPGAVAKRLLSTQGPGNPLSVSALEADSSSGPQLYALTLSGEVLEVKLVESSDGQNGGMVQQPMVDAIYPTATWILFSTPDFTIKKDRGDGSSELIDCRTIAARRSDGALFGGTIGLQGNPNADRRYDHVLPNATGDLVYLGNHDPDIPNKELIYALTLGGSDGPVAKVAIDTWIYPEWYVTNAVGDLFVIYYPSALDHMQDSTLAQIVPAGGGSPVKLTGVGYMCVIHGEFGKADENTFYAIKTNQGKPDENTIWHVTRGGASFVETPQVISFPNASLYGEIVCLDGCLYMICCLEKSILCVVENGVAIADPTPILITGVDHFVGVRGSFVQSSLKEVIIFASTSSGFKFIRHNGITQQDIPIDPNIEVLDYNVAPSGAIDFSGRRADTQEKVRGEIPAGQTNVNVISGGLLNPAQVTVFTRIN